MYSKEFPKREEQRLGEKIIDIFQRHERIMPSGPLINIRVGLILLGIQRKCEHKNGYETFVDPDGVIHEMCVDCVKDKDVIHQLNMV